MRARRYRATVLLLALLAAVDAAADPDVEDPGQGPVTLTEGDTGAAQLSGITWSGADRYFAVSDRGGRLFPLRIEIDTDTGFITSSAAEAPVRLDRTSDLEGVAWTPRQTVLTSDESGAVIREHQPSDGAFVARIGVPAVFRRARLNLSLESLSLAEDGVLWTANEEALRVDGRPADAREGTLVRLQRFGADGLPGGQWTYRTDPYPGKPVLGLERSGVVDLLALPPASPGGSDGPLLVLERSFSDQGFRIRLYRADLTGATDTTGMQNVATTDVLAAEKHLLWEGSGANLNLEGITLGPELADGSRALVLVSDDSGLGPPQLYALRLRAAPAAAPAADPAVK